MHSFSRIRLAFGAAFGLLALSACTKDRTFFSADTHSGDIKAGTLLINEISAAGSTLPNEEGATVDWFEVYNPNADTIKMAAGHWFATDDPTLPQKAALSPHVLPPHSHTIVFCDTLKNHPENLHANLGLSSLGETPSLFYYTNNGAKVQVDSHAYPAQTSGTTDGRLPNGGTTWVSGLVPTPGAANQ